jgi:hypothetical protein
VDGQPLTYVVLTLRRRILKEKLNFQISRRRDDSSLPSSPPQQTTSASSHTPTLDAPSPPKPTIPTTHAHIDSTQLQEPSPKNSLLTSPPASTSPAKPSTSIVSITVSPSGSLGFVAARLADDVCGAHPPPLPRFHCSACTDNSQCRQTQFVHFCCGRYSRSGCGSKQFRCSRWCGCWRRSNRD